MISDYCLLTLGYYGGICYNFSMNKQAHRDKVLSIIMIMAILGVVGMLGYVIVTPNMGEQFTEFYILGLSGKAEDYPRQIRLGEEGKVIVGIANHERETVNYRVEVRIDSVRDNQREPIELEYEEKWEKIVNFTPDRAADNQKVEILLYKNGGSEPYLKLYLWVDVKE